MRISFIGGGNMAEAIIGGLQAQGFSLAALQVVEPVEARRAWLGERYGLRCCATVDAALLACDVLVLAVKPQQMRAAVQPLVGRLGDRLVISIAAGLRLEALSGWLGGHGRLVRAMPNTPALIRAGITGLYAAPALAAKDRTRAETVLAAVGGTVWLEDEAQMDAVTALSGSGPAYVFYLLEALIAAGEREGLAAATARRLAIETFVGAALLARQSEESLATLRERVTSKGGTTAAALAAFAEANLAAALQRGVAAAAERSRELAEQLGTLTA